MRAAIVLALLAVGAQSESMVVPKVEHETKSSTTTYEVVTRSCPEGYKGHFVDYNAGFDAMNYWVIGSGAFNSLDGAPAYTVCFKKEFMEQVRKNKDLLTTRPLAPRPI